MSNRPDVGSRIGFGDGTPAPEPDRSWPVPGAVYRPNPEPVAGPGGLQPCDPGMYGDDE